MKALFYSFLGTLLTYHHHIVYAQDIEGIKNPLKVGTIPELLNAILQVIVLVATPFVVLAVIWCGFLLVTARGNADKIAKAKEALFYTVIGGVIILGATVLSSVLSSTISQITN